MKSPPGFLLHPLAAREITEIWEYIAEDSPLAARRVRQKIYETIGALASFPHQGHRRPDLTDRPLRFARCYEYLIAYAAEEQPLWVVAVLHGRRSPRLMEAILRDRR